MSSPCPGQIIWTAAVHAKSQLVFQSPSLMFLGTSRYTRNVELPPFAKRVGEIHAVRDLALELLLAWYFWQMFHCGVHPSTHDSVIKVLFPSNPILVPHAEFPASSLARAQRLYGCTQPARLQEVEVARIALNIFLDLLAGREFSPLQRLAREVGELVELLR